MHRINSALLIIVLFIVIGTVAILAQSSYRNKQKNKVLSEMRTSLNAVRNDRKATLDVMRNYEDDLTFMQNHKPIVNFQLRSRASQADETENPNYEWCSFLQENYLEADNVTVYGWDPGAYRRFLVNFMVASGCEF